MSTNGITTNPPRGSGSIFVTTKWTQVLAARDRQSAGAEPALEQLCQAYWKPLYLWIRRQGRNPHDAQDLTQEFFARLLEKNWLDAVDREKGRFRTFLLVALKRFLAGEWDRSRARKRGGGQAPAPFDTDLAEQTLLGMPAGEAPDQAYERQWAMTLLERALGSLRRDYESTGRQTEFEALKDFLTAARGDIPYADVASRLSMSEGAVRVAVHRLRKQFRTAFRQEIAGTVAREEDVDDELRNLLAALS